MDGSSRMAGSRARGHLADLLNFPFQRRDWERPLVLLSLVYAGLVLVIPPLAEALEMGYASQIARRMLVEGCPPALPEQIRWKSCLRDGLRWLGVSLVYNLPGLLVFLGAAGGVLVRYGLPERGSPLDWPGIRYGWPVLAGGLLISAVLGALGSWLANIAVMNLIRRDRFLAAFSAREWLPVLFARPGKFAFGFVFSFGLGLILTLAQIIIGVPAAVLVVAPAIIAAFLGIYHRLVMAAYYAEVFREGLEKCVN